MDSDHRWQEALREFGEYISSGKTVEAIERFYAEDAIVLENRSLARAGRKKCAEWEREQCAQHSRPLEIRIRSSAADPASRVAFWELLVRWGDGPGRMMRLEEVLVQRWHGEHITEERYYYEGVVNEGDEVTIADTILARTKRGGD